MFDATRGSCRGVAKEKGELVKKTLVVAVVVVAMAMSASAAPQKTCFQTFAADMEYCSGLGTFLQRSLCGADAELSLASCVGTAISPWK